MKDVYAMMATCRNAQQCIAKFRECTNPDSKVLRVCSDTWNNWIVSHIRSTRRSSLSNSRVMKTYFPIKAPRHTPVVWYETASRRNRCGQGENSLAIPQVIEKDVGTILLDPRPQYTLKIVSNPAVMDPSILSNSEPVMVPYSECGAGKIPSYGVDFAPADKM